MLLRLLTAGCLSAVCLSATAQEHHDHAAPAPAQAADISVSQVWSRAMPPSAPTGAVYFLLNNGGKQDDRLIAAHTERAEKTELHTHVHEGDVMRMQQVESVAVPAGDTVQFQPGGNHVMLFGLKQPLAAGERFALTLEFEHAGEITTDVDILDQAPGAQADPHAHH
ncbi:copper chaperone PCu(A)C [Stutzerimonas stutzeri]|uniref:copper chaperone PCu(A)C n=1 Tax=Stutzerimonas sp. S1 TaxID=3030652 RepID=UPI002225426F|nr:copper chaperone PCu(A)C [Stutzerimonas sp. S1]MCW3148144.1 copper chaperone PCu(A)C [Stutzerimonas sp. S1]